MDIIETGLEFDLPKNKSSIIKVIGVGGGGSNAVNHMKRMGINGVDFIVCNTDQQALEHSPVENQIQLGVNLTEGLGAGANPDVGRKAAEETLEEVRELLKSNTKMVFITAGMGGGTGTGAAPVIARCAKEMNILTVGIVTKPFKFEGKIREKQALEGIEELRKHVDSLIVINNDKLREVYGNLSFRSGFAKADEVLATAAKGIAEVITYHFTTNIDLRDVRTVLENSGTAIMGSAIAGGTNRAKDAVLQALDSPLLNDNHIKGATNVLLLIVSNGGEHEITMDEMSVINEHIQEEAGGDTNVIMGIGIDNELKEEIHVTVIATGFPHNQHEVLTGREPQKIIHPLDDDQAISKNIFEKPFTNVDDSEKSQRPKRKDQPDLFSNLEAKDSIIHNLDEEQEIDINQAITPLTSGIPVNVDVDASVLQKPSDFLSDLDTEETNDDLSFEEEDATSFEPVNLDTKEIEIEEDITSDIEEKLLEDELTQKVKENANEVVFEFEAPEASEKELTWEEEEEILHVLDNAPYYTVTGEEGEDFLFELDDIDGEGIYLNSSTTADEPQAELEETQYDPFDLRIESAFSGPEELEEPEEKKNEIKAEEVIDPLTPRVTDEPQKRIVHTLDDLLDLEQKLQVKKPVQEEPLEHPKVETPFAKAIDHTEKTEDTSLEFEVKTKEPSADKQEPLVDEDFLNRPLTPAAWQKILERKSRLEAFNYTFKNAQNSMLENEPAYKRQGISVSSDNYSAQNSVGRMMLGGEADETEIKTNNSFLHDNVD